MRARLRSNDGIKVSVTVLCAVLILTGVLTGAFLASASTPPKYTLSNGESVPRPNSCTVWTENGQFLAKNADGSIDYNETDAAAILNSAFASGGEVYVKAGNYPADANISISEGTNVIAEEGATIAFSGTYQVIITGDYVTVENLRITGTLTTNYGLLIQADYATVRGVKVSNIGTKGVNGFGICFDYDCRGGLITQCHVKDTGLDGIHIRRGYNCVVSFCIVENSGDDAVAAIWGTQNKIIGNSIDRKGDIANSGNGIYLGGETGSIVESNTVTDVPRYGICVDTFREIKPKQNIVKGNTIRYAGYCTDAGIQFGGIILNFADGTTCTSNTVEFSYFFGIRIYNGTYNIVNDNIVANNHIASEGWGGGICLDYQSTWNIVSGNQVNDYQTPPTQDYGIVETGTGVDYNTISDATAVNNVISNIHIEGVHSKVSSSYNGTTWIS